MIAITGQSPNKDNVSAVLNAAGCTIDDEKLKTLFSQVEGKDIGELVEAGRAKLQSVPTGGAASAGAAATPAAAKEEAAPEAESERRRKKIWASLCSIERTSIQLN